MWFQSLLAQLLGYCCFFLITFSLKNTSMAVAFRFVPIERRALLCNKKSIHLYTSLFFTINKSSNKDNKELYSSAHDYTDEEIILCMHLAFTGRIDDALSSVSKYCQLFPFSAVLPVQPLFYMPIYDDGGVEVYFMRKKTDMKSSADGGIRFFVKAIPQDANLNDASVIEVMAKRNSHGQVIKKLIAEKLIVTSFVSAFTGQNEGQRLDEAPAFVKVISLYHKWM